MPGMRAASSARIPRCSVHRTSMVRDGRKGWVCPTCFTEWLNKDQTSRGGVELPAGVQDERLTFERILPNRRARRAVMS